jgi:outer membrane receptor protein involved in Fe transport
MAKQHNRMQYTPMETINRNGKMALLLLSSLLAVSLSAQTDAPKTETSDEVIELSPFSVQGEKENGYKASNSIGGTRSNTPIKDIALNIQVFTKDLANDLVIADQTQLERYNAALVNGGADAQSDAVIQQAYNAFLFRGFVQNWSIRDGVREYDPVDSIGIQRVEVVKGPAAALYGLSYAGGVMNTITKKVDMTKNFASVYATVTSQGGERATIDANFMGKLGNDVKAGVRYAGAGAITEDSREHSKGKTRYNQINAEIDPTSSTQVQLLVENEYRNKPNGLGYYSLSQNTNPGANSIDAKYQSKVVGVGSQVPLQVLRPDVPWTWNWANGNVRALETSMYKLTVNQAFGENFHVTAYVQNNQREQPDSNGWDDGNNSEQGAGWDSAGGGWMLNSGGQEVIRSYYHWRDWNDMDHAQGVTGVYKLETGPIKNTITAGWAHWDERFVSRKILDSTNYWDLAANNDINTHAADQPAGWTLSPQGGNREHNQNSYEFASWQVSAIDNRLKVNAAINHTKIDNLIWPNNNPGNSGYSGSVHVSKNSPMLGGMFDITKEISIFAVHSTSLFPTTDKNDELTVQMPPEVGKSNEIGIKTELLNGKISATASYYKIEKTGGGVRDISAENDNKKLWDTYHAQGISEGNEWKYVDAAGQGHGWSHDRAKVTTGNGYGGSLGDIVPAQLESKGFEADIVYQPIKTLQLVVSYAHNTEESTAGTTQGQSNSGHIKDQVSGLVKYTFDEGSLKGGFLGLGYQYSGKANADYQNPLKDNPAYIAPGSPGYVGGVDKYVTDSSITVARYTPATFYLEAFGGYKFKAFGVNQSVQFNIKNLTKQAEYFGWQSTSDVKAVATERYKIPTHIVFSLTYGLDF